MAAINYNNIISINTDEPTGNVRRFVGRCVPQLAALNVAAVIWAACRILWYSTSVEFAHALMKPARW